MSSDMNMMLGDTTGRTITKRTGEGLTAITGIELEGDNMDHVVHSIMVSGGYALISSFVSRNLWLYIAGLLLVLAIVFCWLKGGEQN